MSNPAARPLLFHLVRLGCPKNDVDAEAMECLLSSAGYLLVPDPARADLVLVNTCAFIDAATDESLQATRKLLRRKRAGQRVLVLGCLPQRAGETLLTQLPRLDGALTTRRWGEVVSFVEAALRGERPIWVGSSSQPLPSTCGLRRGAAWAYVKIADGCSATCTYCVIPRIKGAARSRPLDDVVAECRALVAGGALELILVAQDTTAYGLDIGERDGLAGLIEAICRAVPDLHWLRVMYAHPAHLTERLAETMAAWPQVCRYLDLPLQHAHPDILRAMGRPDDIADVRRKVAILREAMPDLALRTTFMVGYPGETEEHFTVLMDFVRAERFDRLGCFVYSPQQGTRAAALPGVAPPALAESRQGRVMRLQQGISRELNAAWVGRELDVLVEQVGNQGVGVGRSYRDAPEVDGYVLVRGGAAAGRMVRARITGAQEYDLVGEVVAP